MLTQPLHHTLGITKPPQAQVPTASVARLGCTLLSQACLISMRAALASLFSASTHRGGTLSTSAPKAGIRRTR